MPGGGCEGRWWDVAWETREADIPSMTANGDNLAGSEPMVSVVTMIDGGMWLRPLRGDMLRLPELEPQVCFECTGERVCVLRLNSHYTLRIAIIQGKASIGRFVWAEWGAGSVCMYFYNTPLRITK